MGISLLHEVNFNKKNEKYGGKNMEYIKNEKRMEKT